MIYNIKAGVLGLEELGMAYTTLLREHIKNLKLLGAVGRNQKELLYAKNDLNLEYVYSDEKSLIENHDIDTIFIFSDPQFRPHQAIKAIEAGKHVFIADPIALNVEDALAVKACADSHPSQIVMSSSMVRHSPLFHTVQQIIASNGIGALTNITLDSNFFNGLNRQLTQKSGSLFIDSVIDELDLCLWLIEADNYVVKVSKSDSQEIVCHINASNNTEIVLTVKPAETEHKSIINIKGDIGKLEISNDNYRSFLMSVAGDENIPITTKYYSGFLYPEYLQLHHFVKSLLNRNNQMNSLQPAVDVVRLAVTLEKGKLFNEI